MNDRIAEIPIFDADGEKMLTVYHAQMAYIGIKHPDGGDIQLDYEEAAALAWALKTLCDFHKDEPEKK